MAAEEKKIIYLCADAGIPYWGCKGGSIHIREIVGALQQIGYRMTVVANTGNGEKTEDSPAEVVNLPDVENDAFMSMVDDIADREKTKAEMMEFYRNIATGNLLAALPDRADLVYERYSLFGVAGLRFARSRRIPFVLEVNAPLLVEAARYRDLIFDELARDIERYLFNRADHIIAVSDELKRYIMKVSPGAAVTVIPNGVRIEHFQNPEKGYDAGKLSAVIGDSDLVVGFVGSLKPWHGLENLIDSFVGFSQVIKNGRLLIIGGNEGQVRTLQKRCLRNGLKGKVIFTGAVPYDRIPALLQRTDVLVAPYPDLPDYYFSSLKIFEYMAAGKAIVASAIGQIPSVLAHEKTALLIRPGDNSDLREAMIRLVKEPSLRRTLGENALAEATAKHSWQKRAETLAGILDSLESRNKIGTGAGYAD